MDISFKDLNLNKEVLKSIEDLKYENPTMIQTKIIPLLIEGHNLIGQSQTGTGKTLSYAAGILSKINKENKNIKVLVLTPTRELSIQVCEEFNTLNKYLNYNIMALYGGSNIGNQINELKKKKDIIVGTPGRIIDLIERKVLDLNHLDFLVLDEADEMLDMGFLDDIKRILKKTNNKKQVLMFSATMKEEIENLASSYMNDDYKYIADLVDTKTSKNVKQTYYLTNEKTRIDVLCRILDIKNSKKTIIFCQTKKECDELLMELCVKGYECFNIHGDMMQEDRLKTLNRFKNGDFKFLLATDVAARGIHIEDVDLVINYRFPQDFETYIHRIGRTGRVNSVGEAISIVNGKEIKKLKELEKFINVIIEEEIMPSKEEIIKSKYELLIEKAKLVKDNNDYQEAMAYVRDLNKGDLMYLAASLLKISVDKQIGSNLDKDIEYKESTIKHVRENHTRLFLTIGIKDSVKKGSLLDFLKKETNIDKDNYKNIEVLKTFTFIDVNNDVLEEFIKKISNKKFNNKTIRIEKAKNQS